MKALKWTLAGAIALVSGVCFLSVLAMIIVPILHGIAYMLLPHGAFEPWIGEEGIASVFLGCFGIVPVFLFFVWCLFEVIPEIVER